MHQLLERQTEASDVGALNGEGNRTPMSADQAGILERALDHLANDIRELRQAIEHLREERHRAHTSLSERLESRLAAIEKVVGKWEVARVLGMWLIGTPAAVYVLLKLIEAL